MLGVHEPEKDKKHGGNEAGSHSDSACSKTVGLPISQIATTNLNFPMNQKFSFEIRFEYKILEYQQSVCYLKTL